MTVKQISIFIENKSGTMLTVLETLKAAGIQIIASAVSDTVDYGIYRIICSDPNKALEILRSRGISVTIADVFAVELEDVPGMAADAVQTIAAAGININYLYSFLFKGKGILIFRTNDTEKTLQTISDAGLKLLTPESFLLG